MKRQTLSIKKKMMSMVVIAILIPLTCLLIFTGLYQKEIIEKKRNDELNAQAQHATRFALERIESAVKLSKNITYEGEIEKYNDLYKKNKLSNSSAYKLITETLKDKFYLNKEILFSAVLLDCNPRQVYSITADGYYRINEYLTFIHSQIEEVTKELGRGIGVIVREDRVYIIRNLLSTKNFEKYGVLINELDTSVFFKEFFNHSYLSDTVRIWINGEELIINAKGGQDEKLKRGKVLTIQGHVEGQDLLLEYKADIEKQQVIAEEMTLIRGITIGVLVIVVLLSFLLCGLYIKIIGPIEALTKAFKKIEEGDLGVEVRYDGEDELGFLIQGFNAMSRQTKYLINCVYKEELRFKEAKLKALQSQINPHFINNTLEIINWKAQMIGGQEISKMIRALSVIMNASSSREDRKMVTLREEMSYMDSYLYILQRRFEDRIHITKIIDEALLECEVPPLMIQPLLENAVVHGIEPAKGGEIVIQISQDEEILSIKIANNGKSLDEATAKILQQILSGQTIPKKQHRLGIRNVNERIKLIYGEAYGLSIYTNTQGMTESFVVLPIKYTNNSNKAHPFLVKNH